MSKPGLSRTLNTHSHTWYPISILNICVTSFLNFSSYHNPKSHKTLYSSTSHTCRDEQDHVRVGSAHLEVTTLHQKQKPSRRCDLVNFDQHYLSQNNTSDCVRTGLRLSYNWQTTSLSTTSAPVRTTRSTKQAGHHYIHPVAVSLSHVVTLRRVMLAWKPASTLALLPA